MEGSQAAAQQGHAQAQQPPGGVPCRVHGGPPRHAAFGCPTALRSWCTHSSVLRIVHSHSINDRCAQRPSGLCLPVTLFAHWLLLQGTSTGLCHRIQLFPGHRGV